MKMISAWNAWTLKLGEAYVLGMNLNLKHFLVATWESGFTAAFADRLGDHAVK